MLGLSPRVRPLPDVPGCGAIDESEVPDEAARVGPGLRHCRSVAQECVSWEWLLEVRLGIRAE